HKLGTPQSEDVLVFERPDHKDWLFDGNVTDDGRYLIISIRKGSASNNLVAYKDLKDPGGKIVELVKDFEADYNLVDNDGAVFWVWTTLNAPRGRLIAIDTRKPEKRNCKEIIPTS